MSFSSYGPRVKAPHGGTFISPGFHGRPREQTAAERTPPGQYVVNDFPVLSAGPFKDGLQVPTR
jgi:hypothetical protein